MIAQTRKNIMDLFIDGARRGFTIATTSLLPNVVMAFVIIQAVLLASVMSMGGGVGVCASLVVAGTLSGHDATILLPAIYLMGNPVQNTGRCLGTAGVNPKYYPHIIAVCVINALLSMWVMQLLF